VAWGTEAFLPLVGRRCRAAVPKLRCQGNGGKPAGLPHRFGGTVKLTVENIFPREISFPARHFPQGYAVVMFA